MKRTIDVTEIHVFTSIDNPLRRCTVHSKKVRDCKMVITITGWNPFPCYSMETSWPVFRDWMKANRWREEKGITREIIIEEKED